MTLTTTTTTNLKSFKKWLHRKFVFNLCFNCRRLFLAFNVKATKFFGMYDVWTLKLKPDNVEVAFWRQRPWQASNWQRRKRVVDILQEMTKTPSTCVNVLKELLTSQKRNDENTLTSVELSTSVVELKMSFGLTNLRRTVNVVRELLKSYKRNDENTLTFVEFST